MHWKIISDHLKLIESSVSKRRIYIYAFEIDSYSAPSPQFNNIQVT